jgi:RNA polymerase sigma-70 factor (ECF subfamily)
MNQDQTRDIPFERIKQGDMQAFEVLFRNEYAGLARFANKFVRDPDVAEEITQEIFLYLWEKRAQINLTGSLMSYLYSATKNKCINYLKLEYPKYQKMVDIHESMVLTKGSEVNIDNQQEIKTLIDEAISLLPEKCKEIFMLSRYGGLTYEEIADDLEISKKTVENQMSIALKKLRTTLKPILKRISE